jgi:hypothetical protein
MRPKSIVTFERLALLSLAIALIVTAVTWGPTVAAFRRSGYGLSIPVLATVFEFGVGLVLIYFISRKGNRIAKWILAVLTAASVVEFALRAGNGISGDWVSIAEIAKILLLVAAVCLLFTADAKPWFARRGGEGQPAL